MRYLKRKKVRLEPRKNAPQGQVSDQNTDALRGHAPPRVMARWPPPLRAMVVLGQPHERRSRPRSRSLALTLRCSSVDGHVLGRRRRCRLVLPRDKGGTSVNRQSEARGQCAYGSH